MLAFINQIYSATFYFWFVHIGFAAGGNFNYVGSGTNYLCLPRDPQFSDGSHAVSASFTNYIYGAEYETNFFGDKSADQDVPCAVCQSTAGTNILMIPGRLTCYQGWTRQYKGFLSSNYYGYKGQSEYVCVEENAEYLFGGEKSTNGALFYPTIFACGTLQCPPYKNDEPVTCVVCSK
ncbi:hypothetical protein FSP39_002796 [Pinctada imbricata]|uniref:Uncharacterized protein n=1 Tax=Pinctada imbricata TaxID=66713 RepID=A0AA89BWR9_PINIB|nr:hypothetical protein FSP39_002796 [Pinctada imbricata]